MRGKHSRRSNKGKKVKIRTNKTSILHRDESREHFGIFFDKVGGRFNGIP